MMEISVLNAGVGDYKAEFDTDEELARQQMAEFIADALGKGYALFLEDGDETHRVTGYDPFSHTFTVISSREKKGRAVIRVGEDKDTPTIEDQPKAPRYDTTGTKRRGRKARVTAVAQSAGG